MKTLFLLRHAKASSTDESVSDFDRPLNEQGRNAAESVGRFIAKEGINPALVLSSPVVRARETSEIVRRNAKLAGDFRFDARIYEASLSALLEVVSQIEDEADAVLLVGHNPGIEELARFLTGQAAQFSTAALARINLPASLWSETREGEGTLEWLTS